MEKQFIEEEFRPIKGFEGYYVSDLGNVLSLKKGKPKLLKPHDNGTGYQQAHFRVSGKQVNRLIHVLVAEAFLPERPSELHELDHRDRNRANNMVSNLCWLTHQENIEKACAKKVICLETGNIYESATKAARAIGKSDCAVANAIWRNRKAGGFHWRYLDEC